MNNMNNPDREGLENFETDIEIYNILVDKQLEEDDILTHFNIEFGPQARQENEAAEVDTIYIIRGQDTLTKKISGAEWFTTHIQVIIHVSCENNYDANEILHSTYRRIKYYLAKEPLWAYTKTMQRTPLYKPDGRLTELAIDFQTQELEETHHKLTPEGGYEAQLRVSSKVEHTRKLNKKYPPIDVKREKHKNKRFI